MRIRFFTKSLLFFISLLPLAIMLYQLFNDKLGAEPVAAMLTTTGVWAMRFLLMTLAITPMRQRFAVNLMPYRRMLGLYAFFYALLHFGVYWVFEQNFSVNALIDDALKRNFIFIGMLAFILLIPLVITSTNAMMKRLGKRWKKLHKAIYWITALGLLHFAWIQKSDYTEPLIYTAIFIGLLGVCKPSGKSLR